MRSMFHNAEIHSEMKCMEALAQPITAIEKAQEGKQNCDWSARLALDFSAMERQPETRNSLIMVAK